MGAVSGWGRAGEGRLRAPEARLSQKEGLSQGSQGVFLKLSLGPGLSCKWLIRGELRAETVGREFTEKGRDEAKGSVLSPVRGGGASHPTVCRAAPTANGSLAPTVNSAEVEKPWIGEFV